MKPPQKKKTIKPPKNKKNKNNKTPKKTAGFGIWTWTVHAFSNTLVVGTLLFNHSTF